MTVRKIYEDDWKKDNSLMGEFKELMQQSIGNDDASVGIFWYDIKNNELFGVRETTANTLKFYQSDLFDKKVRTYTKLHYQIWDKEKNKKGDRRFWGNYTEVPRGRIFEVEGDGFKICVGSWFQEYPNVEDLVIEEFNLPRENTTVIIDSHWDLGHGWSDRFV